MKYLIDTSVLVRLYDPTCDAYNAVKENLEKLDSKGDELTVAPQIIYEFWAVVTRPKDVNGLGMLPDEADWHISQLLSLFDFVSESEIVFGEWRKQVTRRQVRGRPSHDARIAAFMISNKIENLLTLNPKDFRRFTEINVVDPTVGKIFEE